MANQDLVIRIKTALEGSDLGKLQSLMGQLKKDLIDAKNEFGNNSAQEREVQKSMIDVDTAVKKLKNTTRDYEEGTLGYYERQLRKLQEIRRETNSNSEAFRINNEDIKKTKQAIADIKFTGLSKAQLLETFENVKITFDGIRQAI